MAKTRSMALAVYATQWMPPPMLKQLYSMKLPLSIFAIVSSIPILAQPVLIPSSTAISPSSVAGAANVANTTGTATSFTLLDLSTVLTNLQNTLDQALPVVASVNSNLDFVGSAQNGLFGPAAIAPMGNFSSNLGNNSAANLGVNAAVSTGGSLFNTAVNSAALTTNTAVNSGAVASNTGLVPGAKFPGITRDTVRALLGLQDEIERMLPLLSTLNGGTSNSISLGLSPGFITENPTNPLRLSPTGR
jgi:hypothetical protein